MAFFPLLCPPGGRLGSKAHVALSDLSKALSELSFPHGLPAEERRRRRSCECRKAEGAWSERFFFHEPINDRYLEKITVKDIATQLLCNQQQLSLRFRDVMRMSLTDYICFLRLSKAKSLLLSDSSFTPDEIAETSGFNSTRHFLKCFKEHCGMTPKRMKQEALKNKNRKNEKTLDILQSLCYYHIRNKTKAGISVSGDKKT